VQGKFDRAVALLHNFLYPETVRVFEAVINEDPDCAMAYWGLAMSELSKPWSCCMAAAASRPILHE
jgi:hypothetical protein